MRGNLSHYDTFIVVAESSSVSQAAKKLSVSQPAISAEIASLENALGVRLFFRTNRGVRLTKEGEVLYEYIKKGISFINAGEDKLSEISGLKYGKLTIGASDMTLRFFLLDHIVAYREKFPGIMLSVSNAPTPKTLEALRSGEIDIGLVSEPYCVTDASDFEFVRVKELQDIFIAHPSCPLCREPKVSKKRLSEYPLNMLEGRTSTRAYVSNWLGNYCPEPSIELATSELLVQFAAEGLGVSSVVEDFALDALSDGRVVKISMTERIPPRHISLAYLKRVPLSVAAKGMISLILESIGELK